ncbi:MAG: MFS transporter, partial [Chloroflexi bacterium]|nr:MFS transporter [Chloroflexota bacterium]
PILHLTAVAMLVMVLVTIGPGFASRVLGLQPEDAIYIFGPAGIGMLLSTLAIGRFGHRYQRDHLSTVGEMAISFVLLGLAVVGWASSASDAASRNLSYTPIVMVLALLLGVSLALIAIPAQTSLQERSPTELRGRVFALLYTLTSLIVIVPLLFIGALADRIGIPSVSMLVALATVSVGLYSLTRARTIRDFSMLELSE